MRRIDKFLNLDELDEDCVEEDPTMTGTNINCNLFLFSNYRFNYNLNLKS